MGLSKYCCCSCYLSPSAPPFARQPLLSISQAQTRIIPGNGIFICTAGRKSGVWTKIAVPGNWELQGFGSYNYGHDKVKSNEQGLYKEVTVDKTSANTSVNDAERKNSDFWVFGGIFRPVYLEIVPETFIDRIAVNATADGLFKMDVYPQNIKGNELIEAQVQKLNGEKVGKASTVKAAAAEGARQLTLWLPDNKAP